MNSGAGMPQEKFVKHLQELEGNDIDIEERKRVEEILTEEIERRRDEQSNKWNEETRKLRQVKKYQPVLCKHLVTRRDHLVETEPSPIDGVKTQDFNKQMDDAGHPRPAYNVFDK